MNIVFITHYPGLGGANIALLHMMIWLRKKYNVTPLVIAARSGDFGVELKRHGIKCIEVPISSWRGGYSGCKRIAEGVKFVLRNIYYALIVTWRLRREKITLVHGNSSLTGFAFFLAKTMRVPLVWHQREYNDVDYQLNYYLGKRISGRILGHSDAVIAISEAVKSYYAQFIIPSSTLVRIYDGVDVERVGVDVGAPLIRSVLPDQFSICVSGGVCEGKNQLEVLKALSYLKECGRLSNIHLYILGGNRSAEGYGRILTEFEGTHKLDGVVHYLGWQKDIASVLSRMDVSVCSFKREGFGLVVIESMMCGVPVIVSDSGALPELITSGVHGYVYPEGDYRALAEALCKVKSGLLGSGVAERVRKHAIDNFTAEKNADEVYRLYKDVMTRRGVSCA